MAKIRNYLLVLLVLIIGVGASVIGFRQIVLLEEAEKQKNFVIAASDRMVAIERAIQSNLDSVLSIKSFFESNLIVQREQFRSFVSPLLKRNSALQALEWIPNVSAEERSSYESVAKSEGFKNFKFTERSGKGKLIKADTREDFFPVFYLEPMKGNESVFGFDLGSSVDRRIALEAARDSGRIVTSESIALVQNGRAGVLLFAPIYEPGWPIHSIELRRDNITGFALGAIDIQQMISAAFISHDKLATPDGIDFYIFDNDKIIDDPLIYLHQSRKRTASPAPKLNLADSQSTLHVTNKIEIGDRKWLLVARPIEPNFGATVPFSAWGVLLLGLVLSGTIAILLKSNIDRNQIVEAQVIERTAEISAKTKQIELMHDVTVIANEADKVDKATQTCIDVICDHAGWQVGHAFYVSANSIVDSGIWHLSESGDYTKFCKITAKAKDKKDILLPWLVLDRKQTVWLTDNTTDHPSTRMIEAKSLGLHSVVAMPVMIEKEVVAVLEFFYDDRVKPDDSLVRSLAHTGTQLGRVFERKKIENMKSEFISTVSHELRTPLTSIKGSLGLIVSGVTGKLSDSLSDMVNIAYNNSDRLVRLINDILDIEKIEVGKMEFNLEVLELAPLMKRVVAENIGFAEEYNVRLELFNSLPDTKVQADNDRIIQAITNLISNAVKFSPEDGIVAIDVAARKQGIRISVSDRGPGIPEEFREKIFSKFAQADSTDSRAQGGTGLGLSISKAIVEEHFGTIGFDTIAGDGTTFFIDLPVYQERLDSSPYAPRKTKNAPRVLIVEDDRDIAKLLEFMLRNDGVDADIVYNAADAKQALIDTHYDAMTLDLVLPDQDGISLVQEIRQFERTRDLPIVVVSAKAIEGKKELNGHAFGIIDWIQKPIDQKYLNATLLRAIRSGSDYKPHILHVEDDLDVAQVVSKLVDDIATVTLATSLAEGKELLRSQSFDLVVLDLMLPDGAGEDLLTESHKSGAESPPFIVFSAKEIQSSTISDDIKAALVKSRTSNEKLVSTIRAAIEGV